MYNLVGLTGDQLDLIVAALAKLEDPQADALAQHFARIRAVVVTICPVCGKEVIQVGRGRRRKYCGRTCAQAAYRERVRESRKTTTRPRRH